METNFDLQHVILQRAAMVGPPDIVVATPACIATCISKNILQSSSLEESLSTLVLDEVL
jgi:ATP-dependent RNA helicase DDX56/DBP9